MRHAIFATTLVALLAAAAPATADVLKAECIQANTTAQDARRDGKFSAAREQLRKCADPACPAMVRDDCTRRLDELEKAQPTIAFEVKDAAGADVTAISVTVDGKPLADTLEGKPLPVDSGKHVFAFRAAGRAPFERTFVLTEGEKGRRERIVLEAQSSPAVPTAPAPPPSAAPSPSSEPTASSSAAASGESPTAAAPGQGMSTQQFLGLGVGGVGIVGLGLGGVFAVLSESAWNQAKTDCGGNTSQCTNVQSGQSDRSSALTEATVSTVGFIAGGALLATGTVLFFTGAKHGSDSSARLIVAPSVAPGQAGIAVAGGF
jgi:hypothetical protein